MANQIGQNMMLVNSTFRNAKSFTLIPVSLDSPYTEAMFDPASGILAVISKVMKQSYHMVPKLNDDGEPIRLKTPNQQTGKTVKEERRLVDTFSEFYLSDKADIETSSHNIPHDYDKTGESLIYANDIDMSSGGTIRVYCTDWSNKLSEYLETNVKIVNSISINKNSGRPIRAIVPMHTFGHPCNLEALVNLAKKYNIAIVEDAAEALGSYYKGKHVGTFGLFGTLSFNGNKTITTGGGGAILTNNKELAKKAKHLTTTAKVKHSWEFIHDQVGYNYRMPNINAALGCAQLESITNTLKRKRQLFNKYEKAFHNITGVNLVKEPKECKSNYWLQTLLLDNSHKNFRDNILKATNKKGIMTRPAWTLMHLLEPYKDFPKMNLSQSINLSKRLINIPSSSNLIQS